MSKLGEIKSPRLLKVLKRAGFKEGRRKGSHRFLDHPDGRTLVFAFHEGETVGPKMVARVLKDAGISTEKFHRLR